MKGEATFDLKTAISYQYPIQKVGGFLWGDRTLNLDGSMLFEDKVNGIKAVVFFEQKKQDHFIGKLYRYDPSKELQHKTPTKIGEIRDIEEVICEISGSWLHCLVFDE